MPTFETPEEVGLGGLPKAAAQPQTCQRQVCLLGGVRGMLPRKLLKTKSPNGAFSCILEQTFTVWSHLY